MSGFPVQPGRPDQPPRLDAGPVHRPRDQLPGAALDPRGLPSSTTRSIRIVFASTRQIYGKPDYLPVDESHLLRPVDVNGINKMAGEWYHILYNNVYGIRACALRLTNTYGPRMRVKDARQTFLGIWIALIARGQALRGLGRATRCATSPMSTTRSRRCCWRRRATRRDGQVFNLGGAEPRHAPTTWAICWSKANGGGRLRSCDEFPAGAQAHRHRRLLCGRRPDSAALRLGSPGSLSPRGSARTLGFYRENLRHYQ